MASVTTTKQTKTSTTATVGTNKVQTDTTTTVATTDYDNGVVDISIIPYIPNRQVAFHARGLRPNRRVWFNFDGTDVTDYIIPPDYIRLTENTAKVLMNSVLTVNNEVITVGTGTANLATVIQYGRHFDFANANTVVADTGDDRTRQRTLRIVNRNGVFAPGQQVNFSRSGNTGTIELYESRGGTNLANWFSSSTANTIILPIRTSQMANNYWGTDGSNTIVLIPSSQLNHRPLTANIVGFNNVTRVLTLSSATGTLANLTIGITNPVTINTSPKNIGWRIQQSFITDNEGQISGIFNIPAGKFRTGERIFRIIDTPLNTTSDATTYVDYKFDATGLQQTKEIGTKVSTSVKAVQTVTPIVQPSAPASQPEKFAKDQQGPANDGYGNYDPIAESFYVNEGQYPNGMFLTSVDIFFRSKDNILPASIQIRPMVNGYPSAVSIMPNGEASVMAEHIRTSNDGSAATNFKFTTPVYLAPGQYALVVKSDSLEYEAFTAELGGTIIGTNRKVSRQPYIGSLFKSQNGGTWDAVQTEDLAFVLYKAVFTSSGSAILSSVRPDVGDSEIVADKMITHINSTRFNATGITYQHSYPNQSLTDYKIDNDIIPNGRVLFNSANQSYNLVATMATGDTAVSPVIYPSTGKVITFQNYVDRANLAQSDFTIVSPLGGFPANANIPLTILSANGSGAVAFGNANSSGFLTSIQLASGGINYTDNVSVTVGSNTGIISLAAETNFSGGPAMAKYISRGVVLADGFDANDLKVYLTAYMPAGTDVLVYYKIKASNDPEPFERKKYVQMARGSNVQSSKNGFRDAALEYEYSMNETQTGLVGVTYTAGGATFSYFNQYAIKIVLISDDTTNVPIVYDMRAIALPL